MSVLSLAGCQVMYNHSHLIHDISSGFGSTSSKTIFDLWVFISCVSQRFFPIIMSYEHHNKDQCDRCDKEVGEHNLMLVPFLYKDMNDRAHRDEGDGYRQYRICKECIKVQERMNNECKRQQRRL